MQVTIESINSLVSAEIGSEELYNKRYAHPIWPGGLSGVTIGIGYDLGYHGDKEITDDWAGYINKFQLSAILSVFGLKALAAKDAISIVKNNVEISYETAIRQFQEKTLPRYAKLTQNEFHGVELLPPSAQGGILMLCYNRGTDTDPSKDPRREMYEIKQLLQELKNKSAHVMPTQESITETLLSIAALIREMKRLWNKDRQSGLIIRRETEAYLVEHAQYDISKDKIIQLL